MLVHAFGIFSGDMAFYCSWSRHLIDRLSADEVREISSWEKLGPEVESPRFLELIDSHCHVDRLLEQGVLLSSLFQDAHVRFEYILASLNFPNSWDTHRMLMAEARIFLTIGLHPHVASQPISDDI